MADNKHTWIPSRVREIGGDVLDMLDLRRRLAEAEIRSDFASGKRLAIGAGIGAAIAVVGLSLFTLVLAGRADAAISNSAGGFPHVSFWSSLLLVAVGGVLVGTAVRRFRSDFCGFRESLAELKEDMVWLRESLQDDRDQ